MKKPLRLALDALLVSVLLWLPVTSAVFVAGCTGGCTTSQKTAAYKTLAIVATSVDAGMKAFADAVVAGKVPQPTQDKVKDLHGRYQKALQGAILTAHFDMAQAAPGEVQALAAELLALITEATKGTP